MVGAVGLAIVCVFLRLYARLPAVLGPERRNTILRLLDEQGRVVASGLAPRLGVSLDPVRRALDGLPTAGALRAVPGPAPAGARPPAHGGALPSPTSPRRFVARRDRDRAAKRAIAEVAVAL